MAYTQFPGLERGQKGIHQMEYAHANQQDDHAMCKYKSDNGKA